MYNKNSYNLTKFDAPGKKFKKDFLSRISKLQNFVNKNDILLLGMTGVGKTTLIEHLQQSITLRYISLGAITRSTLKYTPTLQLEQLVKQGGVWPFGVIKNLIKPFIAISTPYVLDGIPKHEHEAKWIANYIATRPRPTRIISLHTGIDSIIERLGFCDRLFRTETQEDKEHRIQTFHTQYNILLNILRPNVKEVIEIETDNLDPYDVINILSKRIS